MKKRFWFLLIFVLVLVACVDGGNAGISPITPTVEPPIPLPETTEPATDVTPPPTLILPATTPISLTIWLPPEFNPISANPKGADLAAEISNFAANQANFDISVASRATSGSASILNYLRTGRNVAPTILPQLILLPASQLTTATNEQFIYPMTPYLTEADVADLFPLALDMAGVGEELMGYPYALNGLTHLAYNPTVFTDTVPALWPTLAQTNATLVFPTANNLPATLVMQLYLDLGGTLRDENNNFALDQTILSNTLGQLQQAQQAEVLSLQSIGVEDYNQALEKLTSGEANMTILDSETFLVSRETNTSFLYASIPGLNAPLKPAVTGWVWVLATADPALQANAMELIRHLTSSESLGKWSAEHNQLPARPSAFGEWATSDPYTNFLQTELNQAQSHPAVLNSNLETLLQEAFFNTLNQTNTPDEAAQKIITQINQP